MPATSEFPLRRVRVLRGGWPGALLLACAALRPAVAAPAIENVLISRSGETAEVLIRFGCPNRYLVHGPGTSARRVEISLVRMSFCEVEDHSISEATRPAGRALALLEEIEYQAMTGSEATLRLHFVRPVEAAIEQHGDQRSLRVVVQLPTPAQSQVTADEAPLARAGASARSEVAPQPVLTPEQRARAEARAQAALRLPAPAPAVMPLYVINLRSTVSPPDPTEASDLAASGQVVYVDDLALEDTTWHRLRLGFFATEADAEAALASLRVRYPVAWVTAVTLAERQRAIGRGGAAAPEAAATAVATAVGEAGASGSDGDLLAQAQGAIIDGDFARAVELATGALGDPDPARAAQSRELLGLARERNGQNAHAVAEYRRYLDDFPYSSGAERVRQRLAALTTAREPPKASLRGQAMNRRAESWDAYGGVTQYYRHDSLDFGNGRGADFDMLFSDAEMVVRHTGERFDFGARTTLGYDYDLGGEEGPGSRARVYNAWVDLDDRDQGLAGRLGRQTLRNQGVLGRFDGAHLSWQMARDYRLNLLGGFPVYTSDQGMETGRLFYGASLDLLELFAQVDANVFFNIQDVDGVSDRQAVGGEVRYFGDNRSLITAVDVDVGYGEVNSLVALGNWTFDNRLTVNAMFDWRRTPYLTTENALIGQPVSSIDELLLTYTESEIRRLAADRTGSMQTVSLGLARPIAERFQVSADVTVSEFEGTPASGGVPGTPDSGVETWYYLSLMGSSLLMEGDVSMIGLRYSSGRLTDTASLVLDARYPLLQWLRVNPNLLISHRTTSGQASELLLRPGLRLFWRLARHYQLELDVGAEFSNRDLGQDSEDTQGYHFYLGYRADF